MKSETFSTSFVNITDEGKKLRFPEGFIRKLSR